MAVLVKQLDPYNGYYISKCIDGNGHVIFNGYSQETVDNFLSEIGKKNYETKLISDLTAETLRELYKKIDDNLALIDLMAGKVMPFKDQMYNDMLERSKQEDDALYFNHQTEEKKAYRHGFIDGFMYSEKISNNEKER